MKLSERFPALQGLVVTNVIEDASGLSIAFEGGWSIGVSNPYSLRPAPGASDVDDLRGARLVELETASDVAELRFADGAKLRVDLRDDAFVGPEAMELRGPGGVIVVWN